MTGRQLQKFRMRKKMTQVKAARELGVSQTYLSLLENGKRDVTERLKRRAVRVFGLPATEVPVEGYLAGVRPVSDEQLASELSALGYKGFAHLKPSKRKNPAAVLVSALNSPKRGARLVEALPWVVLAFPDMDWRELARAAKANDLQNRLGYVTSMARSVAESRGDEQTAAKLRLREVELEHSLLAREETLCNETMTNAERRWLATHRPEEARRWHLLTDLNPRASKYYA